METGEEKRNICGYEPACLGKAIAWLHIGLHAFTFILIVLAITLRFNVEPHEIEFKSSVNNTVLTVMFIGLIIHFFGIPFSLIFLKGITEGRPSYLTTWTIFASLLIIWVVIATILGNGSLIGRIIHGIVSIVIHTIGIWIVYLVKSDLVHVVSYKI